MIDPEDEFGMRVRWFGKPWPSEERRAGVCDDDAYKIETPVGTKCLACTKRIEEGDWGIVTACSPSIFGFWLLRISDVEWSVCSYHSSCFIRLILPHDDGMAPEIKNRMRGAVKNPVTSHATEPTSAPEISEEVEPGKGWRSRE